MIFVRKILIYLFCIKKRCLSSRIHRQLERSDETELPSKEKFYSCLNMKNITDTGREYLENLK